MCVYVIVFCLCVFGSCSVFLLYLFFLFKQKTAYEMRISDWSSDVCSSDLIGHLWRERRSLVVGHGVVVAAYAALYLSTAWSAQDEIGRASCRERVCQYV